MTTTDKSFQFEPEDIAWCPGCGNFAIRRALIAALDGLGLDPAMTVVSPCGACRELIFDYDPKARVIVPSGKAVAVVPIAELLPNKYSRGPEG